MQTASSKLWISEYIVNTGIPGGRSCLDYTQLLFLIYCQNHQHSSQPVIAHFFWLECSALFARIADNSASYLTGWPLHILWWSRVSVPTVFLAELHKGALSKQMCWRSGAFVCRLFQWDERFEGQNILFQFNCCRVLHFSHARGNKAVLWGLKFSCWCWSIIQPWL